MRLPLLALLASLAVVVGCGSSGAAGDRAKAEAATRAAEQVGAIVRFGGDWKTDFTRHTVPLREFQSGGPGKDGIPALDHPTFVKTDRVRFLNAREPVIELVLGSQARAYPLQILIWHEIVNDRIGHTPVAVTFCPLCNTAIAFDRRVGGRTLSFGTTGNLRNSDLVMYDRQTESWWQQFGGDGVVGRYAGRRLRQVPVRIVAWREFLRAHPHGLVLSQSTGYSKPYGSNPYVGYDDVSSPPFFPVKNGNDQRLPPKERVVFIARSREAVAISLTTLVKRRRIDVSVAAHELVIRFRPGVSSALDRRAIAEGRDVGEVSVSEGGRPVAFTEPFWFAVAAFRPDVKIVR
ncbi:MAG: DUF3179 domain-containing protein [Actinomycetota bacterium]